MSESRPPYYGNDYSTSPLSVDNAVAAPRIAIESVRPQVEGGRFAAKALVGRAVQVSAIIFADGHDKLGARLLWRQRDQDQWQRATMTTGGNDLWEGEFVPEQPGKAEFVIEAWMDEYASFCDELRKKHGAGVDVGLELREGEMFLERLGLDEIGQQVATTENVAEKVDFLLAPDTVAAVTALESHPHHVRSSTWPVDVERREAEFASWYELFPRSITESPDRHGTFKDVIGRLPAIAIMGFDVLYFPPIHPIGHAHRKGPNNTLVAREGDPGSPYAIGNEMGGHDAIHPELGTLEDFTQLVEEARRHKLEIALDFAIQCSPDHPWLKEHPGWFSWRPDGTIRHAENPPKKYEDIVNVDFYADAAIPDLWLALRDVVAEWVRRGVTLFRVDNPHTKPMPFWEWLIADIRNTWPEVIFLSEAFTRPSMMARLGKLGFSQSYTYFTWRNTKQELSEFYQQLNSEPWRDCYRPNFFVNTPDINPYFLHHSGRAGFLIRAALATMGAGSWGMYSGFELCEAAAVPGKEEYLDSEKYEIRVRDFHAPGNIVAEITQLNRIRRSNPALQTHLGFKAYTAHNDNIFYFGKRTADRSNFILVAISLDPHTAQEAQFELPLWELGLPDHAVTQGEDLMTGHTWQWFGKTQRMRIEPWRLPFGIWRFSAPQ